MAVMRIGYPAGRAPNELRRTGEGHVLARPEPSSGQVYEAGVRVTGWVERSMRRRTGGLPPVRSGRIPATRNGTDPWQKPGRDTPHGGLMSEKLFSRHYDVGSEMLLDFLQQAMA